MTRPDYRHFSNQGSCSAKDIVSSGVKQCHWWMHQGRVPGVSLPLACSPRSRVSRFPIEICLDSPGCYFLVANKCLAKISFGVLTYKLCRVFIALFIFIALFYVVMHRKGNTVYLCSKLIWHIFSAFLNEVCYWTIPLFPFFGCSGSLDPHPVKRASEVSPWWDDICCINCNKVT